MLMPDDRYLFGRVVAMTDADLGGSADFPVVYVYRVRSQRKEIPDRAELRPANLLIPPKIVNTLGWSRGYFETVANIPLDAEDTPAQLCFFRPSRGHYVDHLGRPLPSLVEPAGIFAVGNYRTLDDEVSEALGISLGPD